MKIPKYLLAVILLAVLVVGCGGEDASSVTVELASHDYNVTGDLEFEICGIGFDPRDLELDVLIYYSEFNDDWDDLHGGEVTQHVHRRFMASESFGGAHEQLDEEFIEYIGGRDSECYIASLRDAFPDVADWKHAGFNGEPQCPINDMIVKVDFGEEFRKRYEFPCQPPEASQSDIVSAIEEPNPDDDRESEESDEEDNEQDSGGGLALQSEIVGSDTEKASSDGDGQPQESGAVVRGDFCEELYSGSVLSGTIVDDDLALVNYSLKENGRFGIGIRRNSGYDPFDQGEPPQIGVNCMQVDNISTGELGEASCKQTSAWLSPLCTGTSVPDYSSGDTLRYTWWIFEVERPGNCSSSGCEYIGLRYTTSDSPIDDFPDTIDGRDLAGYDGSDGCIYGREPCSFSQTIQSLFSYQKEFTVP